MNDKKHVKDFIEHYLDLFPPWNKTHGRSLTTDRPTPTPKSGLIEPLLAETFVKHIPIDFWYGIDIGPKGPDGLLKVSVFSGRHSNPCSDGFQDDYSPKEMTSLYFWWAEDKLRIIPDTALKHNVLWPEPIGPLDVVGIDIADMTVKELAKFIITRIVAEIMEGS